MGLPIRIRLTLWYSGVLLLVLVAFAAAMYFTFRQSLDAAVDLDLEDRLQGVDRYMQSETPRFPRSRLWHEFDENVQLRPDEMLQISDEAGWVFQSQSIQQLQLAPPSGSAVAGFQTETLHGVPVRLRTAVVRVNGASYNIQLGSPLGLPYKALDQFLQAMLGFIPLFVLAASGGGYWLSSRALAPVDRIIQDARSIGHRNLSQRLMVPRSRDELQRLSETLNEMIERLEVAFQRITRFTADASHELRSPVAFIRATAEVALLRDRDVATYRSALADMHSEASRMSQLIDGLLTLARADAGSSQLAMAPVDLREPLKQAGSKALAGAKAKNIRFSTHLPNCAVRAIGDSTALGCLFLILIENAVKYTPDGGSVDVQLAANGDLATISVRDSGIGIAEEEQGRIFERFFRSDKARQRDSGGSGLGLSIARWIADAHRAQIDVESKLGVGSTFTVRIVHVH
jgi:heavy metal sensor kinase